MECRRGIVWAALKGLFEKKSWRIRKGLQQRKDSSVSGIQDTG